MKIEEIAFAVVRFFLETFESPVGHMALVPDPDGNIDDPQTQARLNL